MNTANEDFYPSRVNAAEKIVARRDPVIHSDKRAHLPLDEVRALRFARDGFLVLDNLFSTDEVEWFQQEAGRLQNDSTLNAREEIIVEPSSQKIRSIFDVRRFSPIFAKLMCDARLVEWAQYLLDDEVYLHQSRLNYKPGFEGKEFYWHSDFETWHVEDGMPRMRAVSMSIALTPNYASNGPVMLIPGSHQHYVSCAGLTPDDHYKQSLRAQEYGVPSHAALIQLAEGNAIQAVTGGAGTVLIFDCNAMHGSASNITPYPRNNLFFVYNAVSNRLTQPYSSQKPRPEFIAHRHAVESLQPATYQLSDYRG